MFSAEVRQSTLASKCITTSEKVTRRQNLMSAVFFMLDLINKMQRRISPTLLQRPSLTPANLEELTKCWSKHADKTDDKQSIRKLSEKADIEHRIGLAERHGYTPQFKPSLHRKPLKTSIQVELSTTSKLLLSESHVTRHNVSAQADPEHRKLPRLTITYEPGVVRKRLRRRKLSGIENYTVKSPRVVDKLISERLLGRFSSPNKYLHEEKMNKKELKITSGKHLDCLEVLHLPDVFYKT